MTTGRTNLHIIDGDPVELSRDAIILAAATQTPMPLPTSPGSTEVGGKWFEPIALVSDATDVETRRLSWRSTVQALLRLGFVVHDFEPATPVEAYELPPVTADFNFVLTASLIGQMQRYQGQWIALRGDVIVEHADTLRQLRESLGDRSAAVLKVPKE